MEKLSDYCYIVCAARNLLRRQDIRIPPYLFTATCFDNAPDEIPTLYLTPNTL